MAAPSFQIPDRTSSKADHRERQLKLQSSKANLKRKLSTISFEHDPRPYTKLKIEEVEVDIEEQKLEKEWLDMEKDEKKLRDKDYQLGHRSANKRIISLGDTLWSQNQALRRLDEQQGKAPELGPDTEARSKSVQSAMRAAALEVYKPHLGAPDDGQGRLWCPIAKDYFMPSSMKTAHIVPNSLGPELVDYLFHPGSSSRLHTADNALFVYRDVETSMDNGNFVILPVDATEKPIKRWKIQMTNNAAANSDMGRKTLKELHGTELIFKTDARPAARFLYYHFVITLLRNKRNRQPGWEQYLKELPTGRPFATMGPYLRRSMLMVLARHATDLSKEEESRIMGDGEETYEEEEKLAESEEVEVARRIMDVHDLKEEGEGEGEEEDSMA
ncbi:MAG: hypothetical protein Q9209_000719 [Squamulea sp. 1 TL-2023]